MPFRFTSSKHRKTERVPILAGLVHARVGLSTFNSQLSTANMFKRGYKGEEPVNVSSDRILALRAAAPV
jgi:hypothetical protein